MTMIRWQPLREVTLSRQQINRLFADALASAETTKAPVTFTPAVELREQPEAYVLRVALPGVHQEDVDIQVSAEAVAISAEHRFEKTEQQETAQRSEFRYGKFLRQLALPGKIDPDAVQATSQNGILTLTLPKAQPTQTRKVQIVTATTPTLPQAQPVTND